MVSGIEGAGVRFGKDLELFVIFLVKYGYFRGPCDGDRGDPESIRSGGSNADIS